MGKNPFRKYGQIFDVEGQEPKVGEPESPYEAAPYKAPEQRKPSALEQERSDLAELRGGSDNHWDT